MHTRKLKTGICYRDAAIDRARANAEARTVEIAFSSETPVERYWGTEILDHGPASVRLDRMRDGGPLLVDHNPRDHVGVVESVEVSPDRMGRAVVRFGQSERAREVFQDVTDGIRTKVSVGYMIHRMEVENPDSASPTYRAVDWEPLEVSLVAIPADPSVGVGRAHEDLQDHETEITGKGDRSMDPKDISAEERAAIEQRATATAREQELARINALEKLGEQFKQFGGSELAREAIAKGKTVGDLQAALLERAGKTPVPSAEVGLTESEVKSFSFVRALRVLAFPNEKQFWQDAAFEREVSEAAAKKTGKAPQGILVPVDVLRSPVVSDAGSYRNLVRALQAVFQRDLVVGTATAGGHTVSTDLIAGSFIDLLRNRMVLQRLGATVLNGLVGNIAIPRQTSGATAYWVAESGAPTESQQAFDQVTMQPKTVGAFTDYSRKLLLQSSMDVEGFIRMDLAKVIGLEIDRVGLYGTGSSNQPRGVDQTSGINTVNFGAAAPTFAEIVSMETQVAADNADVGTLAYLVNAAGRGGLKTTEKASTTGQFVWEPGNTVNGYRAEVSNQVTTGDYWFGNWADLLIGFWSGLDLMVDPYTGSTAGTVRIVGLQDVDVAVRHPESFCNGNDNP